MGSDSPQPAQASALPAVVFSPVEPRQDAIAVLRRDSASSRSSSHNSAATPTHSSPRPSANPRFIPGPQFALGSNSPPLTPVPANLLQPVDEEPVTPSSTIVEFGDLARGTAPSAAQLVESVHLSYTQSFVSASDPAPAANLAADRTTARVRKAGRAEIRAGLRPRLESPEAGRCPPSADRAVQEAQEARPTIKTR
jgi:hypothetical protein